MTATPPPKMGDPPSMIDPMDFVPGARVQVKAGMGHDKETEGASGTVMLMGTCALGIQFDGTDMVHRWYTAAELQFLAESSDAMKSSEPTKKPGVVYLK